MAITTETSLRQALGIGSTYPTETPQAYLQALLERADDIVKTVIGREIEEAQFVEYYDGDGTPFLNLRQGPVVGSSTLSVQSVAYDTDGNETLTALAAGNFFARGRAYEGWKLPSHLEMHGSTWVTGQRNYKVTYRAGFGANGKAMPDDIVQAALHAAVWMKNKRQDAATTGREVGDAKLLGLQNLRDLMNDLRALLAPYIPTGGF
jgi:hypothetical protein